jgi:hypothetical protein
MADLLSRVHDAPPIAPAEVVPIGCEVIAPSVRDCVEGCTELVESHDTFAPNITGPTLGMDDRWRAVVRLERKAQPIPELPDWTMEA